MEKNTKTVASATKTATANAASSAAKTATPTAETKQATPAKAETKTAEPAAETKPAAVKTETPQAAPATPATPAAPAPQGSGNGAQIPAAAEEVDRKQSFAEMQRKINEELERLSHKKEVADKRDVFLMCGGKIDEYLKKMNEEAEFETNLCRLTFEVFEKDNYGRENFQEFMTVSNTAILQKFCGAMKSEISERVAELETELLRA
jgi:hypothetical protein